MGVSDKRVTLIIEGTETDEGLVDFKVFLSELEALRAALRKVDKSVYRDKGNTKFLVSELSRSSPSRITIEGRAKDYKNDHTDRVFGTFGNVINSIAVGSVPDNVDYQLLEDLRDISRPVGKGLANATILVETDRYDINPEFSRNIDVALSREEYCYGSVEGALEAINIHGPEKHFTIFPSVGPERVKCMFPERLHDEAINSIEKNVLVSGKLKYRPQAPFPYEIVVDGLIVNPPDSELPTFDDLLGIAPDIGDDRPSEEIIRDIRDDWI